MTTTDLGDSPVNNDAGRRPAADGNFDNFFRQEYPAVARMAFLLLGHSGEAEDVTQEAFVVLLREWTAVTNPGAFVRTVAVNRCRDVARRRVVRDSAVRRLRPLAQSSDEQDYLMDVLQALPLQLRAVVVLRYYVGHTVPEIAAVLDTAEGTVKSRLHRAIRELRRHLED